MTKQGTEKARAKAGSPTNTLGNDERQKAGFPRYRGQKTEDREKQEQRL